MGNAEAARGMKVGSEELEATPLGGERMVP